MNNRYRFLIQVAGSLACFWWLFRIVSPDQLVSSLKSASLSLVALVTLIMVPAVLARAWRWYYLLIRRGIPVSLASITNATFIGMALNLFLPASAGDVVRSYYGWQQYGHKEAMLATSLSDKVVALFSLFLLGTIGGFISGDTRLAILAGAMTVPTGIVLVVPVRGLWKFLAVLAKKMLKRDLDAELLMRSFHMSIPTFFGALVISILGWLVTNLMYYFAVLAVGAHISMGYTFAIAPLINIVRMLPISISGLGSADALMVELLQGVGIGKHLTLAASMIVNLTLIVLPGAVGAVLMLLNVRTLKKATAQPCNTVLEGDATNAGGK
ncbi:MAG TPA: lysylphosphatidylglycerol synthase transmembrane domain-containing protein [Nitrospirota bacterium]|nr:lysylphosphatidylglycerol synthase transmembrane domain-containing protein [Nitrospirota bacterium]